MGSVPGVRLAALRGLWVRSSIVLPDGTRDSETSVSWLQGRSFFADLRQPLGRPDFSRTAGIDDLTQAQIAWLATQEGFAGSLAEDSDCVVWTRHMDFQPPSPSADAGRLRMDGLILVEEGRDVLYTEYWARDAEPAEAACWGASLRCTNTGVAAALVRAGDHFGFARERAARLPPERRLIDLVREADGLAAAQALVDCEISLGRVDGAVWRIGASSLPFRERRTFAMQTERATLTLTEDGARRTFTIEASEGDPV